MLVLAHLHRSVLTQQVHSLGHLAFKWRTSFAKALAKLSPNFREKSPNSFYKMIHMYIINTYKYLQCNLDMCTWTFAKTLARKKTYFAISEKTLAETVNCIPKGLRKGNPFHGPFAQLSYTNKLCTISIIIYYMRYSIIMSNALYCYVLSLHVVSWIFKVSSSLIVLLSHMQLKAMRDWTAGRCSTGRPLTETKRQGSVILMMEEILHQLTVVYPIIYRVQNFFHQQ